MHGKLTDLNSDTLKRLSISVLGQPLSKAYLDLEGGKGTILMNEMICKHHIKKKTIKKSSLFFATSNTIL